MMSQASVPPPRFAMWLLGLFTVGTEGESIVGDLHEEYSQLALKSEYGVARIWYWRQALKTVVHLYGMGFRGAPWSTTAVIVGGFLLMRFVSGLPDMMLSAVTDRYLTYWSEHFRAYVWMLNGMAIAHPIAMIFVGGLVAFVAKGRELVATITLALALSILVGVAVLWVGAHGLIGITWILWSCADPLAIMAGGIIVRTRRSLAASLPSRA